MARATVPPMIRTFSTPSMCALPRRGLPAAARLLVEVAAEVLPPPPLHQLDHLIGHRHRRRIARLPCRIDADASAVYRLGTDELLALEDHVARRVEPGEDTPHHTALVVEVDIVAHRRDEAYRPESIPLHQSREHLPRLLLHRHHREPPVEHLVPRDAVIERRRVADRPGRHVRGAGRPR